MPTLMASQRTAPSFPVAQEPNAAITLTFNGVDFQLSPKDETSEISYKNHSDNVVLSLTSFTGSLNVSKKMLSSLSTAPVCPSMTTTTTSTAPTVEDDPESPEQHQKKSRQTVTPGQQTLPFHKSASKPNTSKTKKKNAKEGSRKRGKVAVHEKQTMKKSRPAPTYETPISLGQASQPTQPTQMYTEGLEDVTDSKVTSDSTQTKAAPSTMASVQEILDRDRHPSSGDSVATLKDSNDEGQFTTEETSTIVQDKLTDPENSPTTGTESPQASGAFSYPSPPARWGHTMTKLEKGQILVYGGQSFDLEGNPVILSDVHVYDPKNGGSWHKPINCRGEARQWHTATYIPGRQQIIAFGGETIDPLKGKKVVTSDTLRVLDTEIMLWYPPAASGDIPTGRSGHTATFFPETNELILFGGVRGSKWLNTVSVLDVTRWIWTTPTILGTAPKPRSYHSATAIGPQKLVVFGGNNKSSCFNTVHVLEAVVDENTTCENNGSNGWKWSNPTIRGKAPFPRTGHTATLLEDGKTIMIYGGWDPNEEDELTGEDNIFKGSYLLDTQEWTWKKGPDPKAGGSGSADHVVEDCGAKRCGHTAALNPENGEVFVFGGRIPGEVLAGDVQRLTPPEENAVQLERS